MKLRRWRRDIERSVNGGKKKCKVKYRAKTRKEID